MMGDGRPSAGKWEERSPADISPSRSRRRISRLVGSESALKVCWNPIVSPHFDNRQIDFCLNNIPLEEESQYQFDNCLNIPAKKEEGKPPLSVLFQNILDGHTLGATLGDKCRAQVKDIDLTVWENGAQLFQGLTSQGRRPCMADGDIMFRPHFISRKFLQMVSIAEAKERHRANFSSRLPSLVVVITGTNFKRPPTLAAKGVNRPPRRRKSKSLGMRKER